MKAHAPWVSRSKRANWMKDQIFVKRTEIFWQVLDGENVDKCGLNYGQKSWTLMRERFYVVKLLYQSF